MERQLQTAITDGEVSKIGGILLVNLLPCNMAAFSTSDFPRSWAFKGGICNNTLANYEKLKEG